MSRTFLREFNIFPTNDYVYDDGVCDCSNDCVYVSQEEHDGEEHIYDIYDTDRKVFQHTDYRRHIHLPSERA
jgi:hypothetical protein